MRCTHPNRHKNTTASDTFNIKFGLAYRIVYQSTYVYIILNLDTKKILDERKFVKSWYRKRECLIYLFYFFFVLVYKASVNIHRKTKTQKSIICNWFLLLFSPLTFFFLHFTPSSPLYISLSIHTNNIQLLAEYWRLLLQLLLPDAKPLYALLFNIFSFFFRLLFICLWVIMLFLSYYQIDIIHLDM